MEPIKVLNKYINVCSDVKTVHLFKNITTDLKKTFHSCLPYSLKPIEIYYGTKYIIVQNAVYTEETILNTVNIIFILGPASMQNYIITINKIADTKYTIEQMFAEMPKLLNRPNIHFQNCTFQNNKLIFSTTDSKSKILNTIQRTANAMVFDAYMPYCSIQLQTPETNKHNIFNHLIKEEDDAKKKMQEEDEILYIRQSKPPSPLELSPLEFSDSTVHDNVSDQTYQETYQSKVSVADALSLIKQTVTKDHIILLESEFVNIKNAFRRISSQAVSSCNDLPRFQVANKKDYALGGVTKEVNEIEMKANESNKSSPIVFDNGTSVLVKKKHMSLDAATTVILKKNVTGSDEKEMLNKSTSCTIKNRQNIMFSDSSMNKRELIINKYTRIFLKEIMLLGTSGYKNVKVFKKLSIGVMAIGNKLEYYLYDCTRLTLISLLKENKFNFNAIDLGTINDPKKIIQNMTKALELVDLLVTTGYFRDKNYVKNILKSDFNATFIFENVDMKPGKSTAFASCYYKDKPKIILCLPENPASVFITAYVFFLPLIKWIFFNFVEDWPTINVEIDQTLILHSRPRYVWANFLWNQKECCSKVICNKEHSINYFLSNSNGNALLILPPKTLEKSTLEVSSRVPALLVKFPSQAMINLAS